MTLSAQYVTYVDHSWSKCAVERILKLAKPAAQVQRLIRSSKQDGELSFQGLCHQFLELATL